MTATEAIKPVFKIIAAMSSNRVIGSHGFMPWHVPEDLRIFKMATICRPVIMGRKTFESLRRPLNDRHNIVLSRTMEPRHGITVVRSLEGIAALDLHFDCWVIGGGEIYRRMLPYCQEVHLTVFPWKVDGDTFMPHFEEDFQIVRTEKCPGFERLIFRRLTPPLPLPLPAAPPSAT